MVQVCQWYDGIWRLVIGMMFSGKFETSHINTMYHICMYVAFVLFMMDKMETKIKKFASDELKKFLKYTFKGEGINPKIGVFAFGDDGIQFCHDKRLRAYLNLENFSRFSQKEFDVQIKYDHCGEYSSIFSIPDLKGGLLKKEWKAPDGKLYKIPHGPVFLKRRFVRMSYNEEEYVVPYRCAEDYESRIGRSVSKLDNPMIELVRLHGLMWDTMGTNSFAHARLMRARKVLIEMFPSIHYNVLEMDDQDIRFLEIKAKMEHLGHGIEFDLRYLPTQEHILEKMVGGFNLCNDPRYTIYPIVPVPMLWY